MCGILVKSVDGKLLCCPDNQRDHKNPPDVGILIHYRLAFDGEVGLRLASGFIESGLEGQAEEHDHRLLESARAGRGGVSLELLTRSARFLLVTVT